MLQFPPVTCNKSPVCCKLRWTNCSVYYRRGNLRLQCETCNVAEKVEIASTFCNNLQHILQQFATYFATTCNIFCNTLKHFETTCNIFCNHLQHFASCRRDCARNRSCQSQSKPISKLVILATLWEFISFERENIFLENISSTVWCKLSWFYFDSVSNIWKWKG